MNYRHLYHAGNFADVLKHAVLTRLILYLQQKDKAFRLLDTHAGIGLYDLASEQAEKTGEWREGIGRLMDAAMTPGAAAVLAPYLQAVLGLNSRPSTPPEPPAETGAAPGLPGPGGGPLRLYPGSPKLARLLFRPQDRLSAMELHPEDCRALARQFEGDYQVRVTELDGWLALGAHLPPKEKRGIVLVDPPFELEGDYDRLVEGLARAHRRFATGVYCLWYPIKKGAPVGAFHEALQETGIAKMLCAELSVKSDREGGLAGSGLIIVNPPYTLKDELHALLPELKRLLAQDRYASQRCFWLRGET